MTVRYLTINELRAHLGQPSLEDEYRGATGEGRPLISGDTIQYYYARCEVHGVFKVSIWEHVTDYSCTKCATQSGPYR